MITIEKSGSQRLFDHPVYECIGWYLFNIVILVHGYEQDKF